MNSHDWELKGVKIVKKSQIFENDNFVNDSQIMQIAENVNESQN